MSKSILRIHPAIAFARVGNSEDYYLAPETMAGVPVEGSNPPLMGGLPIRRGTEDETITDEDLRDSSGALKRQAARFKIFAYSEDEARNYPAGTDQEIKIGDKIDGKTVTDIIWTVHVANKKANTFVLEVQNDSGPVIDNYTNGNLPPIRNASFLPGEDGVDELKVLNNPERVTALTIDFGPRTIQGPSALPVRFDNATCAAVYQDGVGIRELPDYPKSYPAKSFPDALDPPDGAIDTLGHLETDAYGRLVVLGGYGKACAWKQTATSYYQLASNVDNDGWFDDTSDGPVSAVVVLDGGTDGETRLSAGTAWVVTADPSYAPQILNVVSLWDEMYDTFVRKLDLQPEIYSAGAYNYNYVASFEDDVAHIFRGTGLQEWISNLPNGAKRAHRAVAGITAETDPAATILSGLAYIRNPNLPQQATLGVPLMPGALGDSGQAFLSPTLTQYFFLTQWNDRKSSSKPAKPLSAGDLLDKASLINCLGGRFSPGIDLTFTVRQPEIYVRNWRDEGVGPFRVEPKPLNYNNLQENVPVLSAGYVPLRTLGKGLVEPGDMTKFMSVPWHTDYNSCATHTTSPSVPNNTTLYWSWPGQRPVNVHLASEVTAEGQPGSQRYSVRGTGTESPNPANQGRYQDIKDILPNWDKIGFVIQDTAIVGGRRNPDQFLEVQSKLTGEPDPVVTPWPMNDSGKS
jgi:hypothetical protein